jgi:hypothetical protein
LSPFFTDDDGNPLTVIATYQFNGVSPAIIPGGIFTQPTATSIGLAPSLLTDLGEYLVTVVVSDTLAQASSSFKINVVNTAPFFVKELPKDFTMKFNTTYTLYVP